MREKEWRPSEELVEELGLDPELYGYEAPDGETTFYFRVMGDLMNPAPKRPRFSRWLRDANAEPMSFPDSGALMNWVAEGLEDQELDDLFREIHHVFGTIFVGRVTKLTTTWRVDQTEDKDYLVMFQGENA